MSRDPNAQNVKKTVILTGQYKRITVMCSLLARREAIALCGLLPSSPVNDSQFIEWKRFPFHGFIFLSDFL